MIVDWEDAFRSWLASVIGKSVMFGFPLGSPVWPVVVMTRLGGGPEQAEDIPRVRIRVWADKKSVASSTVSQIGRALENADGRKTPMGEGIELLSAVVDFIQWAPDESLEGKPSYIMDTTLVFIDTL